MFRFVQFEFPWALGPPDGRYLVQEPDGRGDAAPAHVLVLATLGAPERRGLGRRRAARELAPEPPPTPVATGRATVIDAQPVARAEADGWLETVDAAAAEAALDVLARVVGAHRIASADPSVHAPALAQALVVRAGFGDGDQVAEGRWTTARKLDPARGARRTRRVTALRPQERLADLLAGRATPFACEELTLCARADLDAGALREAALQLRLAFDVALVELASEATAGPLPGGAASQASAGPAGTAAPAGPAGPAAPAGPAGPAGPAAARQPLGASARLAELRELAPGVAVLADAALAGPLASDAGETLALALGRLEATLRARAAGLE